MLVYFKRQTTLIASELQCSLKTSVALKSKFKVLPYTTNSNDAIIKSFIQNMGS